MAERTNKKVQITFVEMPAKWTIEEAKQKRKELEDLYVKQNKTIFETGKILGIKYQTVFDRLKRLGIKPCPEKKPRFCNARQDILIPKRFSEELAEFTGAMLGDGHVSPTQVLVTVNKNEKEYLQRLKELMRGLFGVEPHCSMSKSLNKSRLNVVDIYIGSTKIVKYFLKMGLVMNKVKSQVDIPSWIKENKIFAKGFLRGFFDTDGSIYKLRFGVQLSYTNASLPLLFSARELLIKLGFAPSRIGGISFYLTKRNNLYRFFSEIQPKNQKHIDRARSFGIIE